MTVTQQMMLKLTLCQNLNTVAMWSHFSAASSPEDSSFEVCWSMFVCLLTEILQVSWQWWEQITQWDLIGSQPVRTFCPISGYCSALNFALKLFYQKPYNVEELLKLAVAPSNSRLSNIKWCMNTWIQAEKLNNKFFVQVGTAIFGDDNLTMHNATTLGSYSKKTEISLEK